MKNKKSIFVSLLLFPFAGLFVFAQETFPTTGGLHRTTFKANDAQAVVMLKQTASSKEEFERGSIVSLTSTNSTETASVEIEKTSFEYDPNIIGVVIETHTVFSVLKGIAVQGEVQVKVRTDKNERIRKGDYITSSYIPGIGKKATHGGYVLGRALEDFPQITPDQTKNEMPVSNESIIMNQDELESVSTNTPLVFVKEEVQPSFAESGEVFQEGMITILLHPIWLSEQYFEMKETPDENTGDKFLPWQNNEREKNLFEGLTVVNKGSVRVDENGNMSLDGSLISTGNITATGKSTLMNLYVTEDLTTPNLVAPAFSDIEVQLGDYLGTTEFHITDSKGRKQASITSNGTFIAKTASIEELRVQKNSELIGSAVLKANQTQLFIPSRKVSATSHIFIAPKSSTANQVMYIKEQHNTRGFTVAIDTPLSKDVEFNYWIIN